MSAARTLQRKLKVVRDAIQGRPWQSRGHGRGGPAGSYQRRNPGLRGSWKNPSNPAQAEVMRAAELKRSRKAARLSSYTWHA